MRVVSLLPSATERLFALGVEPVGVSHRCDHSPAAHELPTLTSTVVDHEDRSAAERGDADTACALLDTDETVATNTLPAGERRDRSLVGH